MADYIDIGDNHSIWYFGWSPDRELNPQYEGIPDIEQVGVQIAHQTPDGEECHSAIHFNTEEVKRVFGERNCWNVESYHPLTVSPSILCMRCGDHGFIREGKWVRA